MEPAIFPIGHFPLHLSFRSSASPHIPEVQLLPPQHHYTPVVREAGNKIAFITPRQSNSKDRKGGASWGKKKKKKYASEGAGSSSSEFWAAGAAEWVGMMGKTVRGLVNSQFIWPRKGMGTVVSRNSPHLDNKQPSVSSVSRYGLCFLYCSDVLILSLSCEIKCQ